jgi:hypothetical protein
MTPERDPEDARALLAAWLEEWLGPTEAPSHSPREPAEADPTDAAPPNAIFADLGIGAVAAIAADTLVRQLMPRVLELAGLPAQARDLKALAPITGAPSAALARTVLMEAGRASHGRVPGPLFSSCELVVLAVGAPASGFVGSIFGPGKALDTALHRTISRGVSRSEVVGALREALRR